MYCVPEDIECPITGLKVSIKNPDPIFYYLDDAI